MKRASYIVVAAVMLFAVALVVNTTAKSDITVSDAVARSEQQEARREKRAARLAAFEKFTDSIVISHNYRFVPQTMQQLPAGMMRNLVNPNYEVVVWDTAVDVCLPFLKGYTPPYYPVVFNYVLPSVDGYYAEQTNDGWNVTFKTTMFSATDYTFNFEIYSRYGGAMLTISSPFYNSVQYTGNVLPL